MTSRWIEIPRHRTGWMADELEKFLAGEWFSAVPVTPERLEEMRNDLRRQLRERDAARGDWFYEGWGDEEIDR